ncbi:MAG: hypothetical protein K2K72_00225, partial [Duncaniella sp.]|nr:hypothetical protein [Duncaniella sp.]
MKLRTILFFLASAWLSVTASAEVNLGIIPRPSALSVISQETVEISAQPTISIKADSDATARLSDYLSQVKPEWIINSGTTPDIILKLSGE